MKIKLNKRDVIGKKVKAIRREGQVPVNLYGPNRDSANYTVDLHAFRKLFNNVGYSSLVDLEVDGESGSKKALVKEVQQNPVSDKVIHVSFYEVDPETPLTTEIPIELEGVSPAIKSNIGILVNPISNLKVRCLPKDLVPKFMVDISSLEDIGDLIRISDMSIPDGIELPPDVLETRTVVYISAPQKRVVVETEESEAEEGEEGEAEGEESAEGGEAAAE